MYLDQHAIKNPDRAAIIMASTGKTISFSEFEARANQLAHVLRNEGLQRLDHYSIFMENNEWYLESCAAGERRLVLHLRQFVSHRRRTCLHPLKLTFRAIGNVNLESAFGSRGPRRRAKCTESVCLRWRAKRHFRSAGRRLRSSNVINADNTDRR